MSMKPLEDRYALQGKVAVVVGGAGYLCQTLSQALTESGVTVVVVDISEKPNPDPVTSGLAKRYLQCDITKRSDLEQTRDEVIRSYGKIDILLNGAGTNAPTPFFEITDQEIDKILGVNISAVLRSCQVFGKVMVEKRSGSIINFASASSGPPLSKAFVYSIAKAGVVSLTQNLAREWAPFNVRVNALRPGFFPTEWSMKHFIDEERKAKILGHTPMRRFGRPEELIGAVLWLVSDAATFVTGSVVAIDGGFTAMTI